MSFGADKKAYMDGAYEKELPIVINETAWKMMNVEDPVGMLLQNKGWYGEASRIVGIVKDLTSSRCVRKLNRLICIIPAGC